MFFFSHTSVCCGRGKIVHTRFNGSACIRKIMTFFLLPKWLLNKIFHSSFKSIIFTCANMYFFISHKRNLAWIFHGIGLSIFIHFGPKSAEKFIDVVPFNLFILSKPDFSYEWKFTLFFFSINANKKNYHKQFVISIFVIWKKGIY